MTSLSRSLLIFAAICAVATFARSADLPRTATWSAPNSADVKSQLDAWLATKSPSDAQRAEIDALWPANGSELSAPELLEHVVTSIAVVEPAAKSLVTFCRAPRTGTDLPDVKFLADETQPAIVRHNLRLLYGAWLAQHDMHEEALEQFQGLQPNDVVDPAALLFYRGVCFHRLRDKEECLPVLATLLENESSVPRRFREVARLMQADLAPLEADSLDEVARLMDSIRRRLELGRVGQRVRQEETDVIAKLDKLIEDLEKKRDKQPPPDGPPMPGNMPSSPPPDSVPGGVRGPGDVDPKDLASRGSWGNLPPKARQEALQQISKELPAHYRETIEEYFRKLAQEKK